MGLGLGSWGLGFGVWGLEFGVWGLEGVQVGLSNHVAEALLVHATAPDRVQLVHDVNQNSTPVISGSE